MIRVVGLWLKSVTYLFVLTCVCYSQTTSADTLSCSIGDIFTWSTGFTISNVVVTNESGLSVDDWTVQIQFDAENTVITSYWDAIVSIKDGIITAESVSYNGDIEAGSSTTFGFQGSYLGSWFSPSCIIKSESIPIRVKSGTESIDEVEDLDEMESMEN